MNCGRDGQDRLVPYVLDTLAPTDQLAMDAHVAGCDVCAAEVRRLLAPFLRRWRSVRRSARRRRRRV